ncbi:hypothetical protein Runsl_2074 [Runella slithyformis DSM 19594]|uniref:Uncharacterized protein n=1 Tax=Runella slithyformis (strain ATCC 29530 / DSM 19594 / LMG 11500 / NCIMB 11436 / LSU 4) TaxID=761193 RepID=A0A7U4E5M0_RUNSL|nr:hypothetical protein Runsl_2074 [Runella slithyformis DSM 19594]
MFLKRKRGFIPIKDRLKAPKGDAMCFHNRTPNQSDTITVISPQLRGIDRNKVSEYISEEGEEVIKDVKPLGKGIVAGQFDTENSR